MYTPVNLAPNIYHVGDDVTHEGLNCHPYLLIDDGTGVLFDPGSLMDIDIVLQKVETQLPLNQIKYVVLHHEDPDFCSAVPWLEAKGLKAEIITTWRTMSLVQYYGIQSPYYLLEEHGNELLLPSGRRLEFLLTPYLHFAGAFMTYDKQTKTLFSSDLFGSFSFNKTFYAEADYIEKMKTFHEHYMPCNAILRPVMENLLRYEIDRILPQHGSLIVSDIPKYIHTLRNLECGQLIVPLKKNLLASGGFLTVYNEILTRYLATYSPEEVLSVFQNMPFLHMNAQHQIDCFEGDGIHVWHGLFESVKEQKGYLWLSVIEPYAKLLSGTYSIPMPAIFQTLLESAHETTEKLLAINRDLDQTVKAVQEKLIRCPVTGLLNETFFKSLMLTELESEDWRDMGAILLVNVDGLYQVRQKYGERESDNTLTNMAYLMQNSFGETAVYKMQLTDFAIYIPNQPVEAVVEMADAFRNRVFSSDLFIESMTVSIGIAFPKEIQLDAPTLESAYDSYLDLSLRRLRHAQEDGSNIVCHSGESSDTRHETFKVLLVDSDHTHLDVLKMFLTELDMQVITASDGDEALQLAGIHLPQLIISDVILPKIDGFLLRERLLQRSSTKNIDFIFVSHQKDEVSITRALNLDVVHYLKKPYLLSEVIGIANRRRKGLGR